MPSGRFETRSRELGKYNIGCVGWHDLVGEAGCASWAVCTGTTRQPSSALSFIRNFAENDIALEMTVIASTDRVDELYFKCP